MIVWTPPHWLCLLGACAFVAMCAFSVFVVWCCCRASAQHPEVSPPAE